MSKEHMIPLPLDESGVEEYALRCGEIAYQEAKQRAMRFVLSKKNKKSVEHIEDCAKALLEKIRDGKVKDGFRVRDVYLKGWSKLNTPDDVLYAAEMLVDLGYLISEQQVPGETGGRPTIRFNFNKESFGGAI